MPACRKRPMGRCGWHCKARPARRWSRSPANPGAPNPPNAARHCATTSAAPSGFSLPIMAAKAHATTKPINCWCTPAPTAAAPTTSTPPAGVCWPSATKRRPAQIVALPRKPGCTTRAGCCRPSTAIGSASPSNTTPWAAPWHAPLRWPRPTARPNIPIAPPRAMARTAGSTAAPWPMAAYSSPGAAPPATAPACKGCNCKAPGWPACCRPATTGWAPAPQACSNACCPRRRW